MKSARSARSAPGTLPNLFGRALTAKIKIMLRHTHNELVYYQFESLQDAGLRHGIFTRKGGVSQGIYHSLNLSRSTGDAAEPVRENRRRLLDALGLAPERSLTSWLVHGNHVRAVSKNDLGQDDVHADGMVTNARGLALTMRFADCSPVMFYDPRKQVIGLAHAGWMGIVRGVLPALARAMRETHGCDPADIRACVGPTIGPEVYEVGEDVAAQVQAAVPEPVLSHRQGHPKPYLNMWKAAEAQLRGAGIGQVEVAQICTASNTNEWFSHRAEKGKTGRFGVVIQLDE